MPRKTTQKEKQANMSVIRIMTPTKKSIKILAGEKNLKMVTVLEYLLNGKIDIKELNNKGKQQNTSAK